MTDATIAVVVVNHNTRGHLRRCLAAVLEDEPGQTIVVDTGSRDGSAELVRGEFPSVELVEIENRGYGAGANAGLDRVRAPYALLLNADTRPAPGALAALADYLGRHPAVAVAGPRVVDEQGEVQVTARRSPRPLEVFLFETGLHLLVPRGSNGAAGPVDWILGAALALRRSAIADVGGFDESFFMYNEEVDLCLRLRGAGWEIHHAPVTTVVHVGGASTAQQRSAMAAEYVRSTVLLYRRHFSKRDETLLRAIFVLVLTARSARDRGRLLLTTDRARRRQLRASIGAWSAARALLRRA